MTKKVCEQRKCRLIFCIVRKFVLNGGVVTLPSLQNRAVIIAQKPRLGHRPVAGFVSIIFHNQLLYWCILFILGW